MLTDDVSIKDQIRNAYHTQVDQLDRLVFQLNRNELELAQLITPLDREQKKLDRQLEIKSLQRNLLTQAANPLQGETDPFTLLQKLNQQYQERLYLLKDDIAKDYLNYLDQRQGYLEQESIVELDASKRMALLEEFRQLLDREMEEYQQFKFTTDMDIVCEQQRLDGEISRHIQLHKVLEEQKSQTIETAHDRRVFLGDRRRQLQHTQSRVLNDPHCNFLQACEQGDVKQVEGWIDRQPKKEKKIFINKMSSDGRNGLHLACGQGNYIVVNCLLQQDANPSLQDKEGYFPLHYAAIKNQSSTITILDRLLDFLMKNKIKQIDAINVKGPYGRTPLHTAALFGNLPALKWLLEHGAEVNVAEQEAAQHTPLHNAAYKGHAEVVGYLLEHGADPLARNANDETALFEAIFDGRDTVAQVFRAHHFGLTLMEQKQLQEQLEHRPATQQCLLRFLEPENTLYHAALKASHHAVVQTGSHATTATQLGASMERLWTTQTPLVSQTYNNNNQPPVVATTEQPHNCFL